MSKSIGDADTKMPQLDADIKSGEAVNQSVASNQKLASVRARAEGSYDSGADAFWTMIIGLAALGSLWQPRSSAQTMPKDSTGKGFKARRLGLGWSD